MKKVFKFTKSFISILISIDFSKKDISEEEIIRQNIDFLFEHTYERKNVVKQAYRNYHNSYRDPEKAKKLILEKFN